MNNRLIEIVNQAGFVLQDNENHRLGERNVDWSNNYDKELEKFAELIIAECSAVVVDADSRQQIQTLFNSPLGEPPMGEHITLAEFRKGIAYDFYNAKYGFGYFATDTHVVKDIMLLASNLSTVNIPVWATHVVWYNK